MPHHLRKRGKFERPGWGMLNAKRLMAYRPRWHWLSMQGGDACLKWSFRDLQNLDLALGYVRRKRTAVQAGGNLGIFPKRLAEEFARVYSFEPDPKLHEYSKHNAPESNIIHIHAAIGDTREGIALSSHRRDDSGRAAHEGLTHISGRGEIQQMLIDDLNLKDVDLIYLDIEGYELRALAGAVRTIDRCRPVIVVENNNTSRHYGSTKEDLRAWLVARGYTMKFRLNSDECYLP